jgi:YD repeat-containing protein
MMSQAQSGGSALDQALGTGTPYSFLSGTLSNSYAYDAASNRVSLTPPGGGTTSYSYDSLNRLTGLTDSITGQFGFGYDALGRPAGAERAQFCDSVRIKQAGPCSRPMNR